MKELPRRTAVQRARPDTGKLKGNNYRHVHNFHYLLPCTKQNRKYPPPLFPLRFLVPGAVGFSPFHVLIQQQRPYSRTAMGYALRATGNYRSTYYSPRGTVRQCSTFQKCRTRKRNIIAARTGLTCSVFLEVGQVGIDRMVELQKGVPLVQSDALVATGLQELQEVGQVGRPVFIEHDGQQGDDDLFLCGNNRR
jgi:hypothetical protein